MSQSNLPEKWDNASENWSSLCVAFSPFISVFSGEIREAAGVLAVCIAICHNVFFDIPSWKVGKRTRSGFRFKCHCRHRLFLCSCKQDQPYFIGIGNHDWYDICILTPQLTLAYAIWAAFQFHGRRKDESPLFWRVCFVVQMDIAVGASLSAASDLNSRFSFPQRGRAWWKPTVWGGRDKAYNQFEDIEYVVSWPLCWKIIFETRSLSSPLYLMKKETAAFGNQLSSLSYRRKITFLTLVLLICTALMWFIACYRAEVAEGLNENSLT